MSKNKSRSTGNHPQRPDQNRNQAGQGEENRPAQKVQGPVTPTRDRGGIQTVSSPGVDISGGRSPEIEEKRVQDSLRPQASGDKTFSGNQAPNEEAVRQKAYELYQKRGGSHGNEWEDWFAAQKAMRADSFSQTASQNG